MRSCASLCFGSLVSTLDANMTFPFVHVFMGGLQVNV